MSSPYTERGILAFSQVEAFAEWAAKQGYKRQPLTSHGYEVLRLNRPKTLTVKGETLVFYRRETPNAHGNPTIHATATGPGARLVRQWLKSKKPSA